jgi:hypothetical protein
MWRGFSEFEIFVSFEIHTSVTMKTTLHPGDGGSGASETFVPNYHSTRRHAVQDIDL